MKKSCVAALILGWSMAAGDAIASEEERALAAAEELVAVFWQTCGSALPDFTGLEERLIEEGWTSEQSALLSAQGEADALVPRRIVSLHDENGISVCGVSARDVTFDPPKLFRYGLNDRLVRSAKQRGQLLRGMLDDFAFEIDGREIGLGVRAPVAGSPGGVIAVHVR